MQQVWLPGRWPSLNAVYDAGVWTKVKIKKRWQDSVRLLVRSAKLKPVGRASIHYHHHRADLRGDPSNFAAAAQKIIEDALVEEGILAGDGFGSILGFSHAFSRCPRRPGILVTVTEA